MIRLKSLCLSLAIGGLAAQAHESPRNIDPIVSTAWLEKNLDHPGLIVIDIRSAEDYAKGHIPKAINKPFQEWSVTRDGLMLELPETADLFKTMGNAGISPSSKVVLVNGTVDDHTRSDAFRVAWTLAYAGFTHAAILDGGLPQWTAEKKAVTTVPALPSAVNYNAKLNQAILVSKAYVLNSLENPCVSLLDSRFSDVYFGIPAPVAWMRPGHIPHATCLPSPWLFQDGLLKPKSTLEAMIQGVIKKPKESEVIVYCGIGRMASTMWFVMTQVMGYKDVKIYDGSIQEWSKDKDAPFTLYKWD